MLKYPLDSYYSDVLKELFKKRGYYIIFCISSLIMLILYVFIPIYITPGNDLAFFIKITPWWGFLILICLSFLMGLLITMQFYILKNLKKISFKESGSGFMAWFSSIISGLFSSATCATCISFLFAFLGTGGILFLLKYRWYISGFGFVLVLISIHLSIKRIQNHCESCKIKIKRPKKSY